MTDILIWQQTLQIFKTHDQGDSAQEADSDQTSQIEEESLKLGKELWNRATSVVWMWYGYKNSNTQQ